MITIQGRISHLRTYLEEGGMDWGLGVSKVLWCILWPLFVVTLFRFLYILFGILEAVLGVVFLLLMSKLLGGPFHLVVLDEWLSRLFPPLRSAIRMGNIRVYEFRLHPQQGAPVDCKLKGELQGAGPVSGDFFELEGRVANGTLAVGRGTNLVTGATLRPRNLHSGSLLLITLLLLGTLLLSLFGTFDPLIYEVLWPLLSEP
jgi:hypothetical protein